MAWKVKLLEKLKGFNYLKQERGSVLVLVVLLLPIMFGCLGFAYDFGNLYMHRARLQNVADAAALAGARAYLDSQATDSKDNIDGTVVKTSESASGQLAPDSRSTDRTGRPAEYAYIASVANVKNPPSITHGDSQHPAADKAADDYIFKNIINLGNEVKSDIWSHYALNSDGTNPKTFYRVGLSEKVQLYFLPIIKNVPKTQIVRVGAVVLVEPGTTTENPGGGSSSTTVKTILDYLFTVSDYLKVPNKLEKYEHDDVADTLDIARTTFDGDIVYTKEDTKLDFDGKDPFKYFLPMSEAKGQEKRFTELLDQYSYYAQNTDIKIASSQYKDTFSSVFNSASAISLNNNQMIKTSDMNAAGGNIFIDDPNQGGGRTLVIDAPLEGNENEPVYLMFGGTSRNQCQVKVECDSKRPIVIVWINENPYPESLTFQNCADNATFRGVIYAPYTRVQINNANGFKFYGNIIAKDIEAQGNSQEYHLVNYLKDEPVFKQSLPKIVEPTPVVTQTIFDQYFADSLNYYTANNAQNFGCNDTTRFFKWVKDNYSDAAAFNNAAETGSINDNPPTKKYILKAWSYTYERTIQQLKLDYPGFQLSDLNKINKFPWDGYDPSTNGNNNNGNENPIASTLRLINFRTDFQEKNPDGTENKGEKDPFIYLSLDGKSY